MDGLFNIGDRVVLTVNNPDDNPDLIKGSTGEVCHLSYRIGVRWDDEIDGGHECEGNCDDYHGWYVFPNEIVLDDLVPVDETIEAEAEELLRGLM